MITLNRTDLFAKGSHRECFVLPSDDTRCIKITIKGGERETQREIRYYRQLERRNVSWEMVPKFHGCAETNLGPGVIFDLVRDCDGGISRTLDDYLNSSSLSEPLFESLQRSLRALKDFMVEQRIITRKLKPKNIVYQKTGPENGRLMVIDNLGNTEFIPISTYIPRLGKRKVARKWRRFEDEFLPTQWKAK